MIELIVFGIISHIVLTPVCLYFILRKEKERVARLPESKMPIGVI